MTLEIDLTDLDSLKKCRALLDFHISQIQPPEKNETHLKMLKDLQNGLTEKQCKVWDYFLQHPGNALGEDLKNAVPELKPQGALAGVFKSTQKWVTMGGQREMSPFIQVEWSKQHGCGIYRGLTQEEIDYLNN